MTLAACSILARTLVTCPEVAKHVDTLSFMDAVSELESTQLHEDCDKYSCSRCQDCDSAKGPSRSLHDLRCRSGNGFNCHAVRTRSGGALEACGARGARNQRTN